ncbi:hypothetical protein EXIGLDRAFT_113295 [Exidia glandulosa HHB12029]|uniref:Uncharacterized protein n=1 Tax=Exidia glandulosa HHB12029 TaxID=1314781 RepID=A0A165NP52_EXIGL|nr:hypothetical protein EXIGLDRAFT_113295 [Exidia glandulosa HHB12029]
MAEGRRTRRPCWTLRVRLGASSASFSLYFLLRAPNTGTGIGIHIVRYRCTSRLHRGGHAPTHTQGGQGVGTRVSGVADGPNNAPSRAGFTTTGQTPRLSSTYQMPVANARRPGPPVHAHAQPPHVRTVSGGSGALAFQLPSRQQHLSVPPNGHVHTSSEPNVVQRTPTRQSPLPTGPASGPSFDPSKHQASWRCWTAQRHCASARS